MRELDLQEFVDEIYEDYKKNDDTEYIFFLGAGCSKSSGIKLASELAEEWYKELEKQKTKFDKFNEKNEIEDIEKSGYGKYYFKIFEELFPTPLMQQKEIQRITNADEVNPSLGYYVLASLLQNPQFNTVVTTNFDNLIQDALIYSGNKRALVITHQDLAKFIKRDNTPLITKIHGDAHMQPFNNSDDTKKIPLELKGAIQGLFTNAKVIFIGYGGNDDSIADLLEDCNRIDQVYWLNASEPNEVSLTSWWKNISTKTFINEYDFDKVMNVIKAKFSIAKPDFQKRALELEQGYNCSVKEEIKEIENIKDKDKTYLDYLLLGNSYFDQKEYEKAIGAYKKAVMINSKRSEAYYNMGVVFSNQKEYEKAIESYEKAIEIDPKDDEAYYNMGNAYGKQGEYEK
ncbi:tetratricopeptide repeat protein, partial [Arcobacteraceae bacterium]|nr:tetratricopeptide repeat protein [Arcobacteraceae bacterium]